MQGSVQSSAWRGWERVSVQLNTGRCVRGIACGLLCVGPFSLWPTAAVQATSCEPQAGEEGIAPPFLLSSADFLQD